MQEESQARIRQVLSDLNDSARFDLQYAERYNSRDGGRRNQFAVKAARLQQQGVQQLLEGCAGDDKEDKDWACNGLLRLGHYATKYAQQQRTAWFTSEHDTGYAVQIHEAAKQRYLQCLASLVVVQSQVTVGAVECYLDLLMAVDGGSAGHTKMELTYSEGYEAETTISREVVKQVETKAKVSGGPFATLVGELGLDLSVGWKNTLKSACTFKSHKRLEIKRELYVELSKPCYVYQMRTVAATSCGPIELRGPPIILGTPFWPPSPVCPPPQAAAAAGPVATALPGAAAAASALPAAPRRPFRAAAAAAAAAFGSVPVTAQTATEAVGGILLLDLPKVPAKVATARVGGSAP